MSTLNAQLAERVNIQTLFDRYLQYQYCKNLTVTSTEDFNSFDCLFISAITKTVLMEYKRRQITSAKYPDCLIEIEKFSKLYDFHQAGNHIYYCIEYDNVYAVWNLSSIYGHEQGFLRLDLNHYFYEKECTATSDPERYARGERIKRVRGLIFPWCEFFLTKDFKRISYNDLLNTYKNNSAI